jgi:hypothetical protein
MALTDVRCLVRHHGCQFGLALRRKDETSVNSDEATGKSECVDTWFIDNEEEKL